jgi:hypothetical protein
MQLHKNNLVPPFDFITFIQELKQIGFFEYKEIKSHLIVLDSPLDDDVSLHLITNFQVSDKTMDTNFRHFRLYQYSKSQDAYIGESHFIKVDENSIGEIKTITENLTKRFIRGVYRCFCGKKYLKSVRTANGIIFSCFGFDCENITLTKQDFLNLGFQKWQGF